MLPSCKLTALILSFVAALMLCGCGNVFNADGIIPDDATAENEKTLSVLLSRDRNAIDDLTIPEFKELENYDDLFTKIIDLLPTPREANPKLVYAQIRRNEAKDNPFPIYYTVYEMNNGEKFNLLELATQRDDSCCPLRHIKLTTYNESPSEQNNFSMGTKGPKHFAFLAAMIASVFTIIFTLIALVRDNGQQKKVLWFIFIMFGFWGATMNWTTGDITNSFFSYAKGSGNINIKFLDLTLLGAGFTRAGVFQPWIMEAGIPLGALIYWARRKGRAKRTAKQFDD